MAKATETEGFPEPEGPAPTNAKEARAAAKEESERIRAEVVKQTQSSFVDLQGPVGSVQFTRESLREITFGDLVEHVGFYDAESFVPSDMFGHLIETDEERDRLIKLPFLIVEWSFYAGDFGEFVSANLLTPDNQRFILNDGSKGIYEQLKGVTDSTGMRGMLLCKRGLRVSRYEKEVNGKMIKARTYYLDVRL